MKKEENKKAVTDGNTRKDWEYNHIKITEAFFVIVKEKKRTPTYKELMKATELCEKTIERHLKELKFTKFIDKLKPMTERILLRLGNKAIGGDIQATKLYMQIIENWNEKFQHDHTTDGKEINVIPVIQIPVPTTTKK